MLFVYSQDLRRNQTHSILIYAIAFMCTEPIPGASRSLSSDDDNCSLSITYKRHIFPSTCCIWHASSHHVTQIGRVHNEDLAERASSDSWEVEKKNKKKNTRASDLERVRAPGGADERGGAGTARPRGRNQMESFGAAAVPSYWVEHN